MNVVDCCVSRRRSRREAACFDYCRSALSNCWDEIVFNPSLIVDRCCGHVVELIQLLEARDPSSALPDGNRQSITKLMQLQALSEDAVRQEHERLAREIRLAQQMRQHLLSNLPQQPDSDSCDLRG